MSEKDNGGPAFPYHIGFVLNEGMTLRDWFAGQALAGCATGLSGLGDIGADTRAAALGQMAAVLYEIADAMLAERSKP